MGAEVHCDHYTTVFMRDVNDDSSSSSWPRFYGDKSAPFPQYINNGHIPRQDHERDALKQKMLEHETVFKNQVCELHRLYQIQGNMMEEAKRSDFHNFRTSMEPCSSSCLQEPQLPFRLWGKQFVSIPENVNSPVSLDEPTGLNQQPSKSRKTFDLQLPADDYIDIEENSEPENATKFLADHSGSSSKSASFLGHSFEVVDLNEPVRSKGASGPSIQYLDFTSTESKNQVAPGFRLSHGFFSSKGHGQHPHIYEPGFSRGVADSVAQSNQLDRSPFLSQFRHGGLNHVRMPHSAYGFDHRNRLGLGSGSASHNGYLVSSFSSPQVPSSVPSLVKPGNGFGRLNSAGVVNHVFEPASQSQDPFIRKLFANSSSRPSHASTLNGFYHSSASGSKEQRMELQQPGFSFINDCLKSNPSHHGVRKSAVVAIDLNEEAPRNRSDDEVVILDDLNVGIKKPEPEKHTETLRWLKPKPKPISASDLKTGCENDKSVSKIMGFSVFDRNGQDNEISSVASTSNSCLRKTGMIDINVACDPEEPQHIRGFDLNTTVDYCEDDKRMFKIDLEAPYIPETEQVEAVDNVDLRKAAELVLAMSVLYEPIHTNEESEVSVAESLMFVADAIVELETGMPEMDEFEAMTLELEETREEHYMPKPAELQLHFHDENAANGSTSRPRRGQMRRGRPRRDFQRDILPGLASLSRHKMTEDLQIFGCLMRAMGHCWSPGSTRRNGGRNSSGRGRKRAVIKTVSTPLIHKLNNIDGGSSDDRSLTGWGKMTRRPQRQRCPQGDSSSFT